MLTKNQILFLILKLDIMIDEISASNQPNLIQLLFSDSFMVSTEMILDGFDSELEMPAAGYQI